MGKLYGLWFMVHLVCFQNPPRRGHRRHDTPFAHGNGSLFFYEARLCRKVNMCLFISAIDIVTRVDDDFAFLFGVGCMPPPKCHGKEYWLSIEYTSKTLRPTCGEENIPHLGEALNDVP